MGGHFELLARWGYAARGIVYGIVGAITLFSAVWGGGGQTSSEGALSAILAQPFGRVLLGIIALGLIGHVLWRLAQSILNADDRDHDIGGYGPRAGQFLSALTNGALALYAVQLALGIGAGGGGDGQDSLTAWLMQQPFGRWLVGGVGLAIIAAGCFQVFYGVTEKYRKRVKLPPQHDTILHWICAFGMAARGLLFAVTGGLFVFAAVTVDPEQAGSLSDALEWVRQLPFGWLVYGLAGLGLIAFGGYSLIEAAYRHVNAPSAEDVKKAVPLA